MTTREKGYYVRIPGSRAPVWVPAEGVATHAEEARRECRERAQRAFEEADRSARALKAFRARDPELRLCAVKPAADLVRSLVALEALDKGLVVADIMGPARYQKCAQARFQVWKILRDDYGFSTTGIGLAFGRDHTSVISGLARLKKLEAKKLRGSSL